MLKVVNVKLSDIVPYNKNPRLNDGAVDAVAASIMELGFNVPIVLDGTNTIVSCHTRYLAAQKMGLDSVPCIMAGDMSPEQVRAFRLADNKTGELATWDWFALEQENRSIAESGFNMERFGFEPEADMAGMFDEPDGTEEVGEDEQPKEPMRHSSFVCPCCGKEFHL